MKKLKNKILIPTIASLASVALLVPASTSISSSNVVNSTNKSSTLNAIKYSTVTFNTIDNVTLEGPTTSKVRQNTIFATVAKPRVIHSGGDSYVFKGWTKVKGSATAADMIKDTDQVSTNLQLWPVFVQELKGLVVTSTKDTLLSTEPDTFTASAKPGTITPTITWSVTPVGSTTGTVSITTAGKLTSSYNAVGTWEVKAADSESGKVGTKTITIKAPYTDSSNVWACINSGTTWMWTEIDINSLNDANNNQCMARIIGGTFTTAAKIGFDQVDSKFYIGDQVTSLPDNFMIGNPTLAPYPWSYLKASINFPSTTKLTSIGKCFCQNTQINAAITLPNTLKFIDDGFMMGNALFNQSLTIPGTVTTIGRNFLKGCSAFNQNLTIPATVTHVGADFMANCDGMKSKLVINTDADNFEVTSGSAYSLTLTKTTAPTSLEDGIKIVTGKEGNEMKFIKRFPNRESPTYSSHYRMILPDRGIYNFENADWSEIIEWAEMVEKGDITPSQMAAYFDVDSLIGQERKITINEMDYTVRVIGVEHDTISDGKYKDKKAALTFEFTDLLSYKENGAQKGAMFIKDDVFNNYNYLNSTIRKNLNSTENVTWYDYEYAEIESENKSVWSLISQNVSDLAVGIKETKHYVATTTEEGWGSEETIINDNAYTDKIFIPNYYNMTTIENENCKETKSLNPIYQYYKEKDDEKGEYDGAARRKKDLNNERHGYELSSPYVTTLADDIYWAITEFEGELGQIMIDQNFPVAPCFCI